MLFFLLLFSAFLLRLAAATIDETLITEDGDHSYQLKLPEGVEFANADQSDTVTIKIRHNRARLNKVRVSTAAVDIVNVPEGKEIEILDEFLTVNVRGTSGGLMYVTEKDLTMTLDATPAVTNGDQFVAASIAVKQGNTAELYVVGDYSLQIRVSDAED